MRTRARMRTRLSRLATLHPENTSWTVSHKAKHQGASGMGMTRAGMPVCLQVCQHRTAPRRGLHDAAHVCQRAATLTAACSWIQQPALRAEWAPGARRAAHT